MKFPTIELKRNLRRHVLRGHPWIYRENIKAQFELKKPSFCRVVDEKKEPLGWGIYSPNGALALRIISLEKNFNAPELIRKKVGEAIELRKQFSPSITNAFRLINGEGDYLPGMVCDRYGPVLVFQFDGEDMQNFWLDQLPLKHICKDSNLKSILLKPRNQGDLACLWGEVIQNGEIIENEAKFQVDFQNGQKTGFFLDQRANRKYVSECSLHKSVLNLFSYTGGFSVMAGLGEASSVTSVDISKDAISGCESHWKLNNLKAPHLGIAADAYEFIRLSKEKWDLIIVDPPSMAKSEAQKEQAWGKYVELFSQAAKSCSENGDLILSSCSSHISPEDFFDIITEALSNARTRGQVLHVAGQGFDHPFPHYCRELQYLKFVHLKLRN